MTVDLSSKRPPVAFPSLFSAASRQLLLLSLQVLALCLAASNARAQQVATGVPAIAEAGVYPSGDAVGVYNAVLDMLYIDGRERPPVVVLYDIATRQAGGPCAFGDCKRPWPHKSKIDSALIFAYGHPGRKPPTIKGYSYRIPVVYLTDVERERIMKMGYDVLVDLPPEKVGPQNAFWEGFRHRYPGAWGYAVVSEVAFNKAHTEALVGVLQNCGEGCRSSEAVFLKRAGKTWRIFERIPDDVDASRTSGSLRYRGPLGEKASESQLVATSSPAKPSRSESDDATRVYTAVLNRLYSFHGESPRRVIIMDTRANFGNDIPAHSPIDSSTIANYRFYAHVHELVYPKFSYRIPTTWLNDEDLKQLEREGAPRVQRAVKTMQDEQSPTWLAFYGKYPDAWGYLRLGKPGFNPAHTQALVFAQHFCGSECLNSDVWFLERTGESWRIVERMPVENRPYWGIDGLRYLGADADPKSYKPRRVQGVLTDVMRGSPLANTEVEVSRPGFPSFLVKTDPQGRYLLDNLVLGGLVLKVKCPLAKTTSVVAGAVGVSAGLDTTVNMNVDFSTCPQQ
jgi:hypothetical protein